MKNEDRLVQVTDPDAWPTLDEFPETDTSDLVRTYQENRESVVPEN